MGNTAKVYLLVLGCALTGVEAHADSEGRFELGYSFRSDSLNWNIAADPSGTATPNILSELTWEKLRISQFFVAGSWTHATGWHVRGSAAYGIIFDGRNQDSDYNGNNRTLEFSRSNNAADGDNVWDVSGAFGYRFEIPGARRRETLNLTPLVGYSRHAQNLRITNGFQTIPALGPLPGLDSTYQSTWAGHWIGLELEAQTRPVVTIRVERHWADYYAEANWNLRADFARPKSFEHIADGTGTVLAIVVSDPPKPRRWALSFGLSYQRWTTDPGIDRVFFANGNVAVTRLNEAEWRSVSANFGAEYPL